MKRRLFALGAALVVALFSGCAPIDSSPRVVVTAASDQAAIRLPDFVHPQDLESAVASFGSCVEQEFPIVIRFRTDPFTGMSTEVGSRQMEDGDRVDSVVAGCMRHQDLDRRISLYQAQNLPTPAENRELAQEFISCATTISPAVAARISDASLDSQEAVMMFTSGLLPPTSSLTNEELLEVSECEAEMTGPRLVFNDGHPWFTP